jgi:hypothetical protein
MRTTAPIVAPPLVVAAAAALIPGAPAFLLAAAAIVLLDHIVFDLRRREEPPARPAWDFHAPATLVAARAGRAFAMAVAIVGAALLGPNGWLWPSAAATLALLPAAVGAQLLIRLRRGASVLRLSPAGVEIRGRRYRWDRITTVELNGDRAVPRLDLLLTGRRTPVQLRPADVDASLLFLVDLLGYYQSHPTLRDTIGTPDEAARVHALLLTARLAAGLHGGPRPILVAS